ncbi:Alfin, N-terminal [Dillenia turbinata]|uniref:PHD finger protein ALFIN-LIKE n=1 Tax=Dillenia turbinata TaxID=194707 RepID=A0AAN8ZR71_9MAGN
MIKALTTDVEEFYQQHDPKKENLCLYGFPNEQWEVNLPAKEVPPKIPEPILGIKFARDGMQEIINLLFLQINPQLQQPINHPLNSLLSHELSFHFLLHRTSQNPQSPSYPAIQTTEQSYGRFGTPKSRRARNQTMIFSTISNREFVTVDLVLPPPPPQLPPLIKLVTLDKWLSKLGKMRIMLFVTSFDVLGLFTFCCAVIVSHSPPSIVIAMISRV